jgi:hypothetical protein
VPATPPSALSEEQARSAARTRTVATVPWPGACPSLAPGRSASGRHDLRCALQASLSALRLHATAEVPDPQQLGPHMQRRCGTSLRHLA